MASKQKAKAPVEPAAVEAGPGAFEHPPQPFFGAAEITCQIPEGASLEDITTGLRNLFGSGLAMLEENTNGLSEAQWGARYLLRQAFFVACELNNRAQSGRFTGGGHGE